MRRSLSTTAVMLALVASGSGGAWAQQAPVPAGPAAEKPFLSENDQAMSTMMAGMAVKPTGNVDADFAAMMIPHHQGAIDMAKIELKYGRNAGLLRLARRIVVDQQREIVLMRKVLAQLQPASASASTSSPTAPTQAQPSMHMPMQLRDGQSK
jgi:Domain of unknown function (DUF305)